MSDSIPVPETDIYAFGLVILQVFSRSESPVSAVFLTYFIQVLTGEFPFRGTGKVELGWSVVHGLRPDKPENASSIGFSDSLWDFVYRCWEGNMKLRPKVAEVVTHLERAAENWNGIMLPCVRVLNAVSGSKEDVLDTMKFREFEIIIPLWHCS